jgi:hypothetical protein
LLGARPRRRVDAEQLDAGRRLTHLAGVTEGEYADVMLAGKLAGEVNELQAVPVNGRQRRLRGAAEDAHCAKVLDAWTASY